MEDADFAAHLHPEFGVKVGQRLVEQKRLRLFDDGPADRSALTLSARQLRRLAIEKMRDLQDVGGAGDPRRDLGLRDFLADEAETQIFPHAHVRVERIGLKDHGHTTA